MLRRAVLAAVVALFLLPGLAAAQKPITLWHVFNLDTDIIYIGITVNRSTRPRMHIASSRGSCRPISSAPS